MTDSLLTVVNRVRPILGLPTVTSFSTNDESSLNVQDINDSYLYLLKQLPSDLALLQDSSGGSITTSTGTRLYSMDTDARPFNLLDWSFRNETNDDIPLELVTREYIQRSFPKFDSTTGQPQMLYREGNQLGVYPVPNGTYTLGYQFKSPFTRLSATTDTFLVPDEWLTFVERRAIFLYESRKGFGNSGLTEGMVAEDLISIVAAAEMMNPNYFEPEMFY